MNSLLQLRLGAASGIFAAASRLGAPAAAAAAAKAAAATAKATAVAGQRAEHLRAASAARRQPALPTSAAATAAAPPATAAAAAAAATSRFSAYEVLYCQRRGLHFSNEKEFRAFLKGSSEGRQLRGAPRLDYLRLGVNRQRRRWPHFAARLYYKPQPLRSFRSLLLQQQPLTPSSSSRNNSLRLPKGPAAPAAAAAAAAAARSSTGDAQQQLALQLGIYLSSSSRSGVGERLLLQYTADAAAAKQQLQQLLQQQMPYADITAECTEGSNFIRVCCCKEQQDLVSLAVPADPKKFEPQKAVNAVFARLGFL
ncbi:hypothetical protein, conserved [Eimeria tenella]|uniref:Uncharacterized protein n=1 Tax=Eimeria tenella TaxID=5802 RepID=U6KRT9_EIMTE|nr:hypothetical protein, conserved [Eimeria tenella]CDJ38148.1 hypothetical protein, conserved [Eimeria tenella]|eukprot:XP_013228986.1 hypothetical protein, conserved [Eimeria tenella]